MVARETGFMVGVMAADTVGFPVREALRVAIVDAAESLLLAAELLAPEACDDFGTTAKQEIC